MKPVEIRLYQETDKDAVIRLWSVVFPNAPVHNRPGLDIERKLSVQRELFMVAVLGDKIIGTAMAGYDGHRGWVYYLAVHPEYRHQGIGRGLMEQVESELAALGCPKINLQVRADNQVVMAFYKKLGYLVEKRISMGKKL